MLESWIISLRTEDAANESPAATRERLMAHFPRGATRRMTQLGLTLGTTLLPLVPDEHDVLVYASAYAETRALEGYLDSFPTPSPTLFQTSIHPSSVQQNLIQRQQPVREFLPITGGVNLPAQALLAALLADAPRVILCGGEERGSWLLEQHRASDRTFAFALALSREPTGALGRIRISAIAMSAAAPVFTAFPLPVFFDHLHARRAFDAVVSPGRRLQLDWSA